ncbi:MAG: VWA domain-containing protein [Evtepia gabavorous]
MAGERDFRDFREDNVLDQRSFQLAFRRLRQMTTRQDGPMDVLNLDRTIDETCNNAGYLQLEFDRPRTNDIKVMVLFDSGGSMTPYARLCSQLFQAVNRANNFKDLKIFYFHNCWYSELYTGPRCVYGESVQTQWVINNLSRDYKVIVVGDASMAPSELTWVGGSSYYNRYNAETGLTWLNRFHSRFEKMVWFNPIPEAMWEYDYGYQTIEMIRNTVDMYQLTVEGLGRGLKNWCRPDNLPQNATTVRRHGASRPPAGCFHAGTLREGGPPHEKTGQKTAKTHHGPAAKPDDLRGQLCGPDGGAAAGN